MKHASLILATFLGFLSYPLLIHSAGTSSVRTLFVFKPDGTKHCEPSAGVSLDSMALELTGAGIEVFSRQKGYDGREGIAVCGTSTGQINIYEIAFSDLSAALSLGFKQLPENLIRQDLGNEKRPNHSLQAVPFDSLLSLRTGSANSSFRFSLVSAKGHQTSAMTQTRR